MSCLFATPETAACQDSLSFTVSQSFLKLMFIDSMMPSNNLILYRPLLPLPQYFPTSVSFPMSWLLASGGQSISASVSASVLPMNIQDGFPLELTKWSPCCPRDSQESSPEPQLESINYAFDAQPSLWSNSHIHTWLLEKNIALTIQTFVGKVMSLCFNTPSRFVIAFLPSSKHLLISWLQSLYTVILETKEEKKKTNLSLFPLFPHQFAMKWWDCMPWS